MRRSSSAHFDAFLLNNLLTLIFSSAAIDSKMMKTRYRYWQSLICKYISCYCLRMIRATNSETFFIFKELIQFMNEFGKSFSLVFEYNCHIFVPWSLIKIPSEYFLNGISIKAVTTLLIKQLGKFYILLFYCRHFAITKKPIHRLFMEPCYFTFQRQMSKCPT